MVVDVGERQVFQAKLLHFFTDGEPTKNRRVICVYLAIQIFMVVSVVTNSWINLFEPALNKHQTRG
jgi:hypothetical protein